jgi:hypothetical protein
MKTNMISTLPETFYFFVFFEGGGLLVFFVCIFLGSGSNVYFPLVSTEGRRVWLTLAATTHKK